jgi:signal transduction histidine kinase
MLSTDNYPRHVISLWATRLAWVLSFVLTISLLWSNAPSNFYTAMNEYQTRNAIPAILSFTKMSTFIRWLLAARWMVVGVYFSVALLIAWRKLEDWYALYVSITLMMLAWGFVMGGDNTKWNYPQFMEPWSQVLTPFLIYGTILSLVLLFFLFPNGRFSSRWLKGLALLVILASAIFTIGDQISSQADHSMKIMGVSPWYLWISLLLFSMLAALGDQLYRYRHIANPTQKQQLKWVLFGLGGMLAIPLVNWPLEDYAGAWGSFASIWIKLFASVFLPVTIGFSILRYRLWDIDLLINRSLVYGGLTLLVAATYVLLVGVLGRLFQFGDNLLLSILATGSVAILFNPLRQRLQLVINRVMYGEWDDPSSVLSKLGQRLAQAGLPGEILPAALQDISQVFKAPYVAIRQERSGEQWGPEMLEYGSPTVDVHSFPLVYQGQEIGQLLVASRSPGESFTSQERRLLENIAQQAGAVVYAAQLTSHLQQSRLQLIASREEERRRIHRDLHDGLGPHLATLSLKLDAARNYLASDPAASDQLLQELKRQVQESIQDVRRLVYDLRPPALDQLGLATALQEYAAQQNVNGLQVDVEVQELPALPAAVEVAAYRIALEALTNVARHSRASHCYLHLQADEQLCLQIEDDGVGMQSNSTAGVGLSSMRQRTTELGGEFSIQSKPGNGTRLIIRLPLF